MAAVPVSQTEVSSNVDSGTNIQQYDVIVVGAGFSGIANLHRLRKDGLKVHVFESGMYPGILSIASKRRPPFQVLRGFKIYIYINQ